MNMQSNTLAWMCALALATVGCGGNPAEPADDFSGELSAAEIAELPDGPDEVDSAELAQADSTAGADDAATFDSDDATAGDDDSVSDDDDTSAGSELEALSVDGVPAIVPQAASAGLLKWGLHPRASTALRSVGVTASRIMQTIGNAPASAGTHKQDGSVNGQPYCAATDISVRGLTQTQIRHLLERLGRVGFAAWYRWPGHDGWPAGSAAHIHAVYANAKMKSMLRSQVRSWQVGRNGLRSNAVYHFYTWSSTAKNVVTSKFRQSAGGTTNAGASCTVGGFYCGGDKISGNPSILYRCTGSGAPAVVSHCARGCAVRPGHDDVCK